MKIKVPMWPAHHALKIALLVFSAAILAADIKERHWALEASQWVFIVATIPFLLLGTLHAYFLPPCPKCRPKPPEHLTRSPYRAAIAISRNAGLPLAVVVLAGLILAPALVDKGVWRGDHTFDWGMDALRIALFAGILGFLACVRFDRTNHPDTPRKARITTFLRERAQGLVHRAHWLYMALCFLMVPVFFLPAWGAWGSVGTFLMAVLTAIGFANHQHGMTLCEQCVAEFRADAAEYAEKRRWRFTMAHRYYAPLAVLGLLLVTTSIFLDSPWDSLGLACYFLYNGSFALIVRFHSAYQPWCPYCRRGGGGGDTETEGAPDPSTNQPVPA